MGGSSGEREISLRSGNAIADALEDRGYDVVRIDLQPEKDWSSLLRQAKIDVAFLSLHGSLGEDGCVQGICEVLAIPYSGSSVLSSALAMDKVKAKELFRQHNVPTPPYYVVSETDDLTDIEEIHGCFGFPVVVKPRSEGSSLGMRKVNRAADLGDAIRNALQYDDVVLVERFIAAREINVGILNGRVLGAIEIAPKHGIYDYEAKYTPGMTDYHLPARLPPTRYLGVLNLAERAAAALGCSGACRVDLLVTEAENEYVLEVNTLPGMTETSLLPKIASGAGYSFSELCDAMLKSARLHTKPNRRKNAEPRIESSVELFPKQREILAKAV